MSSQKLNERYWREHGLQQALKKVDSAVWRSKFEVFVQEVTTRLEKGMRVVELGCSGGHWYERLELQDRGCHYTGIEWNPDSVALAKQRYPEADFRCCDAAGVMDLDGFDYLITCQVLYYLDQATLERLLSQLRSGALLTISEPSAYDIDSHASRPKVRVNDDLAKIVYRHPYPGIAQKSHFNILSHHFTEYKERKVKLVMTARRL